MIERELAEMKQRLAKLEATVARKPGQSWREIIGISKAINWSVRPRDSVRSIGRSRTSGSEARSSTRITFVNCARTLPPEKISSEES